jgi:hypothetical protein
VGIVLGVDQYWNMFAPYPTTEDGWYVIKGKLNDGSTYDIWNNQPVNYNKPDSIVKTYVDSYWQSYLMNIWDQDLADYRPYFADYLCRKWNTTHPIEKEVTEFKIYFMLNIVPPPGFHAEKTSRELLWTQSCDVDDDRQISAR